MTNYTNPKHKNTKVDPVFLLTYVDDMVPLSSFLGIKTSITHARVCAKEGLITGHKETMESGFYGTNAYTGVVIITTDRMKNRAYVESSIEEWSFDDQHKPVKKDFA